MSPLAHGSLGYVPDLSGSSELCRSLEPPVETVLEPPAGGTGPQVGRLEPAGFRAALGRLAALSDTARAPARWGHWICHLDDTGRVALPVLARAVGDGAGLVRVSSRGDAVVLRRERVGAPTALDARGRVRLPGWLRARVGVGGALVVAARRPDASTSSSCRSRAST